MAYIVPQNVSSPRDHWELVDVLYDGGPQNAAVAFGRWDHREVVVARWNGDDDDGSVLGNPQSRGLPTWFVLPDWLAVTTLRTLIAQHAAGDLHVQRAALDRALARLTRTL